MAHKKAQCNEPGQNNLYTIPNNWKWVQLSTILQVSKERTEDFTNKAIRYIGLENMEAGKGITSIASASEVRSTKNVFHPGQILYGKLRPYLNKHDVASFDGVCSTDILVFDVLHSIPQKLINVFFDQTSFIEYAVANSKGINLPRTSGETILNAFFPLPPLPEQQRIVDRIESLFAKLDEAKEKAQAVVDGYEDRKAAILHKAFSGELTAKWREENGVSIHTWKNVSVGSVCSSLKYGTAKKSEKSGPVVVLRMGNLQQGEIEWSDLAYTNDEDDIAKYSLAPGDVLFNRTNSSALVGKTSIYRGEHPAIYAGYLIKLDYNHDLVCGDFLNYALNTQDAKQYCNMVKTDGVNQSNINAKKIGEYTFPLPSLNEQKHLVDVLRRQIEKELQAKETAETVIVQIDTMKKAILARAFRGELGTNDPNEEPIVL